MACSSVLKRSSSSIVWADRRSAAGRCPKVRVARLPIAVAAGGRKSFLRKQLALYRERQVKPRRADDATRITLVVLSRLIDWRAVLTIVKPDTLIRWHRKGFRLFWHRVIAAPILAGLHHEYRLELWAA